MAATGTPTPNIGLRIPQGTDPASVDDINYNSNLLDTKLGAVGNTSVQDQIDSLNSKLLPTTVTITPVEGVTTLQNYARCKLINNTCYLFFAATITTASSSWNEIASFPSQYAPSTDVYFIVINSSTKEVSYIYVSSNGKIYFNGKVTGDNFRGSVAWIINN